MSSEPGPRSKGISCPDFTAVETGVGLLPVPAGLAGQMHVLHHTAMIRRGIQQPRSCLMPESTQTNPRRAPRGALPIQRHHPRPQNASPSPRPPPSASYDQLVKQWERLLTWATLKTLQDFDVMPPRPAREASRRLAQRILADYGPSLYQWLGHGRSKTATDGGYAA